MSKTFFWPSNLYLPIFNSLSSGGSSVPQITDIFTRTGQTVALGATGIQTATATQSWLGAPIDLADRHAWRANWGDLLYSISVIGGELAGATQQILWSIPLIASSATGHDSATMSAAASGSYDSNYTAIAQSVIANHNRTTGPIFIRTGWEQNATWQQWAATDSTQAALFISTFRRFVNCFKAVSKRFKFIWCPNVGGYDPDISYPGDTYVDIIGIDFYYDAQYNAGDGTGYFGYIKTQSYGLDYIVAKAASTGKPLCIPEWGVKASQGANVGIGNTATETSGQAAYVALVANWITTNNVLFHCYWDINSDIDTQLSNNQYPLTGAEFKKDFGSPSIITSSTANAYTGESISIALVGNRPGTWSIVGSAGPWSISSGNLIAASQSEGLYNVTVRLTDARGLTVDKTISVNVSTIPIIATTGNILTNPEAIDNAYWSKSGVTVTANQAVGLNPASNTAEKLVEASGDNFHRIVRVYTTTTGTVYRIIAVVSTITPSVRYVNLSLSQGRASFDLQTGTVVTSGNTAGHPTVSNVAISYVGAGRWMIQADFTETAGASREVKLDLNRFNVNTNDSPYYTGDGVSGVVVAGLWVVASTVSSNTSKPTISGNMWSGQTVTASTGTWSPAASSYTYQWIADEIAITGATSNTLTLTDAMIGVELRCLVKTNTGGAAVSLPTINIRKTSGWSQFFIGPAGSNGNAGTRASPWANMDAAWQQLSPGDELVWLDGTYNNTRYDVNPAGFLGSITNGFIIFRADTPLGAKIISPSTGQSVFNAYTNGLIIRGFDLSGGLGHGIVFGSSLYVKAYDNECHHNGASGIQTNQCDYVTIIRNHCHHNAGLDENHCSGISVYQNKNWTGSSTAGIRTFILNNISHDNLETSAVTTSHTDGNGIIVDDFKKTQGAPDTLYPYGALVAGNVVYENGGKGVQVTWSDNVEVRNNSSWGNNRDTLNSATWRAEFTSQYNTGTIFDANIATINSSEASNARSSACYGNFGSAEFPVGATYTKNCSYDFNSTSSVSTDSQGTGSITVPTSGNYLATNPKWATRPNLASDSPLWGAGPTSTNLLVDLYGNPRISPYDVGAVAKQIA